MSSVETGKIRSRRRVKGLKALLPVKRCVACGRPMGWRRAWAKNWERVRYCSEACRRRRAGASRD